MKNNSKLKLKMISNKVVAGTPRHQGNTSLEGTQGRKSLMNLLEVCR